jgi:hypothetical protein
MVDSFIWFLLLSPLLLGYGLPPPLKSAEINGLQRDGSTTQEVQGS